METIENNAITKKSTDLLSLSLSTPSLLTPENSGLYTIIYDFLLVTLTRKPVKRQTVQHIPFFFIYTFSHRDFVLFRAVQMARLNWSRRGRVIACVYTNLCDW